MARIYRPSQQFTCANPRCAKPFTAQPSDRVHEQTYCSIACSASHTHQKQGRGAPITLPCTFCGALVTRYPSRIVRDQVFCNRAHYLAWRHGKELEVLSHVPDLPALDNK